MRPHQGRSSGASCGEFNVPYARLSQTAAQQGVVMLEVYKGFMFLVVLLAMMQHRI